MKSVLIKILVLVFLIDMVLLIWRISYKKNYTGILGYISSKAPTSYPIPSPKPANSPTPTPSPTPTLIPTFTPTPVPSATPTPFPQPKFSQQEIHMFIERFASQYSVDPNVLRHIATCESGFNANARNGPYAGLYQFGNSSWKSNRILMGEDTDPDLRYNAEESVQTAAYIISRGIKNIWPNCYP